jgi:hypothetical protein
MALRILLLFSLLLVLPLGAQQSKPISTDSIELVLQGALRFIEQEQVKQTISEHQYEGEWPAFMTMRSSFVMLGKQERSYDSNCFSNASIQNSLASAFLIRPDLTSIPPMLDKAIIRMMDFYSGNGFNFWPLLPPNGKLYKFKENREIGFVRRPIRFPLNNPYIRKAANVVNDNDDTSQGFSALMNYVKVQKIVGNKVDVTFRISPIVGAWRDSARSSQHYYNIIHFDKRESGAFLTWRAHEIPFPNWNIPRMLVNNAMFLTPMSTLYPYAYVPYIPYGCNDVDAVVNANVLTALAENGELKAAGIAKASKFIERKIKRKDWSRAGIYYPNRYHLHYATLKAWSKGVHELDESANRLKKHLLSSQKADGSFHSRRIVNHKDKVQSTAYALNSILRLGNPFLIGTENQVNKALHYLIKQASFMDGNTCWDGGVFFSGGTVIRNTLYWKSDVYTTALMVESLVLYQQYVKEIKTFW